MCTARKQVLVVAPRDPITSRTVEQLARYGWACKVVDVLTGAKEELKKGKYEIVLAAESISDGRGYDITELVAQCSSSLLVGVRLSDGYLWLPTVERGVRILGTRAVNPSMLEETMEDMLAHPALAAAAGGSLKLPTLAKRWSGRHPHAKAQKFSTRKFTAKQRN